MKDKIRKIKKYAIYLLPVQINKKKDKNCDQNWTQHIQTDEHCSEYAAQNIIYIKMNYCMRFQKNFNYFQQSGFSKRLLVLRNSVVKDNILLFKKKL